MLNKALAAVEDENTILAGVLKNNRSDAGGGEETTEKVGLVRSLERDEAGAVERS